MKSTFPCFIFILLANIYACKSKSAQGFPIQFPLVIIADSVQSYDSIKLPNGEYLINQAQISFISGNYQEEITTLNYIRQSDTMIVEGNSDHVTLGIRFYDAEWLYFMFQQGDTIHIRYNAGFPVCYLANRKSLPYDINYQILKRLHYSQTKPLSLYYQFLSAFEGTNNSQSFYQLKYDDFKLETKFLDSIFQAGQISKEYYTFYKENLRYSFLNLNKGMQLAGIKIEPNLFKVYDTDLKNVNFLQNNNYQWFLRYYVINTLHYGKLKAVHSGMDYDSRLVYDSVRKNKLFSTGIIKFLLLNYFQEICEKGSSKEIQTYFQKFKNDVSDSALVAFVAKKYMLSETKLEVNSKDLLLINSKGVKTTLQKILESKKGKVVVIDFWASWCSPCRQLMPEYHSLISKFKDQDIIFVFLSTDKSKDAWMKACIKEKIDTHEFNYLILAAENSFTETIQLKSIPRSVIFDKSGILVYKDAPHPGTNQLNELILSLIRTISTIPEQGKY